MIHEPPPKENCRVYRQVFEVMSVVGALDKARPSLPAFQRIGGLLDKSGYWFLTRTICYSGRKGERLPSEIKN